MNGKKPSRKRCICKESVLWCSSIFLNTCTFPPLHRKRTDSLMNKARYCGESSFSTSDVDFALQILEAADRFLIDGLKEKVRLLPS